jgi:antitoxin ParD1/3/4
MTTVTISLPDPLKKFVESQVRSKGFGNVSEYFRTLLRQAQEEQSDKELAALLLDGLRSGEDIHSTDPFWKTLRLDAARLLKKRSRPPR